MSAIQNEYRYLIARAEKAGDHKLAKQLKSHAAKQGVTLSAVRPVDGSEAAA